MVHKQLFCCWVRVCMMPPVICLQLALRTCGIALPWLRAFGANSWHRARPFAIQLALHAQGPSRRALAIANFCCCVVLWNWAQICVFHSLHESAQFKRNKLCLAACEGFMVHDDERSVAQFAAQMRGQINC